MIGEHTDYNDGLVLPAAIELGTNFAVRRVTGRSVRIVSAEFGEQITVELGDLDKAVPEKHWRDYFVGVLAMLTSDGHAGGGLEVFVSSSLPIGGGLSSSASVTTGFAFVLRDVWELPLDRQALASLAQRVENEFVGVNCGILDPFSVVTGKAGHLIALDCSTMSFRYVPFPVEDYQVISVDSRTPRSLAESAYNARRHECGRALSVMRRHREITSLSQASASDLDHIGGKDASTLIRRARHIVTENARVRAAVDALLASEIEEFGRLLGKSHQSLRDDFQVSCPELDILVEESLQLPGVIGAKMTGAGFGGCIVAVVRMDASDGFMHDLAERYRSRTGIDAQFHLCNPAQGIRRTSRTAR